ncbi:MAG: isoprenylcysteine carboxylmethyltransferase family protein [Pseudomonadota bacterium]
MKMTLNYPPVWLAGFMVLTWDLAMAYAPWGEVALWLGRALIAAGLLLAIWSVVQFRKARTTVIPHQEPDALVQTGPYRLSRNPIYVADLAILAGWSLTLGTPLGLLLVIPFALVLERLFIRPEEARLAVALGTAYTEYRSRVRRWV